MAHVEAVLREAQLVFVEDVSTLHLFMSENRVQGDDDGSCQIGGFAGGACVWCVCHAELVELLAFACHGRDDDAEFCDIAPNAAEVDDPNKGFFVRFRAEHGFVRPDSATDDAVVGAEEDADGIRLAVDDIGAYACEGGERLVASYSRIDDIDAFGAEFLLQDGDIAWLRMREAVAKAYKCFPCF